MSNKTCLEMMKNNFNDHPSKLLYQSKFKNVNFISTPNSTTNNLKSNQTTTMTANNMHSNSTTKTLLSFFTKKYVSNQDSSNSTTYYNSNNNNSKYNANNRCQDVSNLNSTNDTKYNNNKGTYTKKTDNVNCIIAKKAESSNLKTNDLSITTTNTKRCNANKNINGGVIEQNNELNFYFNNENYSQSDRFFDNKPVTNNNDGSRHNFQELVELNSNLDSLVDKIKNFDDLQRASVILRNALDEINKKQLLDSNIQLKPQLSNPSLKFSLFSPLTSSASSPLFSSPNLDPKSSTNLTDSSVNLSLNISSSSSSNSSCIDNNKLDDETVVLSNNNPLDYFEDLAFANPTYSSSNENLEDLPEIDNNSLIKYETSVHEANSQLEQTAAEYLKKRLKTIKRKDKLKKKSVIGEILSIEEILMSGNNLSCQTATCMPDLSTAIETQEKEQIHTVQRPQFIITNNKTDNDDENDDVDDDDDDDEPVLINISKTKNAANMNNFLSLKSNQQTTENIQDQGIPCQTAPITNFEFEDKLKKLVRNKSLCRSLRKAKFVYLRNRRSKSLEDLSAEDRAMFSLNSSSKVMLKLSRNSLSGSQNSFGFENSSSCSSSAISLISDISSSYFHELNDWSPEFSDDDESDSDMSVGDMVLSDNDANFLSSFVIKSLKFFIRFLDS